MAKRGPAIHDNVEVGSHLYTDEVVTYFGLRKDYAHQVINHAESYVRGASSHQWDGELLVSSQARIEWYLHQR
jgi:hypothetical protein